MAAFKTRRELINQVLDNLSVLIPGQAPSDELVERVDLLLDPALATLNAEGIEGAYIGDAGTPNPPNGGQIELAQFLLIAAYVTQEVAGAFNQAGDPAIAALALRAIERLRVIGRPARTRRLLTTDIQLRAGYRRFSGFSFTRGV